MQTRYNNITRHAQGSSDQKRLTASPADHVYVPPVRVRDRSENGFGSASGKRTATAVLTGGHFDPFGFPLSPSSLNGSPERRQDTGARSVPPGPPPPP